MGALGHAPLEKSRQAVPPLEGRVPRANLTSEPSRNSPWTLPPTFTLWERGGASNARGVAWHGAAL